MAKPLTMESLNTEPKFELTLDEKTHKQLIRYIILTNDGLGRNEFINSVIAKELDGKVLENTFIDIHETPLYFNKNELLENKTVKATKNEPLHNAGEIYVVHRVPNNLDDFNKELKTYCVGNNKDMHAGYYILPKYKDHDETHFSFRYNSEKHELEVSIENPNNIDIVFNPMDDEKQKIKKRLIDIAKIHAVELERENLTAIEFMNYYNIMYSYSLNLELHKLADKQKTEKLTEAEIDKRNKIYFEGIYL